MTSFHRAWSTPVDVRDRTPCASRGRAAPLGDGSGSAVPLVCGRPAVVGCPSTRPMVPFPVVRAERAPRVAGASALPAHGTIQDRTRMPARRDTGVGIRSLTSRPGHGMDGVHLAHGVAMRTPSAVVLRGSAPGTGGWPEIPTATARWTVVRTGGGGRNPSRIALPGGGRTKLHALGHPALPGALPRRPPLPEARGAAVARAPLATAALPRIGILAVRRFRKRAGSSPTPRTRLGPAPGRARPRRRASRNRSRSTHNLGRTPSLTASRARESERFLRPAPTGWPGLGPDKDRFLVSVPYPRCSGSVPHSRCRRPILGPAGGTYPQVVS